jgi:hypothetical protein
MKQINNFESDQQFYEGTEFEHEGQEDNAAQPGLTIRMNGITKQE